MKFLTLFFLFTTLLFSKIYYAKVEPYEIRNISSEVSGVVVFVDKDMLGKQLSAKPYIQIDSVFDEYEIKYTKEKIVYIQNTIDSNEKVLKNLQELLKRKRVNYDKVKVLKIKSSVEKDREFYDLVASENQFLNTQKEINSLRTQLADLKLRAIALRRSINDKNLKAKGFVFYSWSVEVGQVVGMSTPLAKVADISRAKLVIYLDEVDLVNINEKKVYIDGLQTDYKISRVLNIADEKNISKYMAHIIIKSPKIFSKLVQVELK